MDEDTIDLVRRLLLQAGMAMEDVCDMAVLPPSSPEALQDTANAGSLRGATNIRFCQHRVVSSRVATKEAILEPG